MARIAVGTYMIRYPLGGMMSWSLQWLVGLRRLGHDVYLVEKSGYPDSCFDPAKQLMSDDCTFGVRAVSRLLARFGLQEKWCYVDAAGAYHGLPKREVEAVFKSADLFLDLGTHGAWLDEAAGAGARVVVDGEPGSNQMKMAKQVAEGRTLPAYDFYYTNGANIGTEASSAPTLGRRWRHVYNPVVTDLYAPSPAPPGAPFTTVMNWQSHKPFEYEGRVYGQKDVEFSKFIGLPRRTAAPMEISVSGSVPRAELERAGWRIRSAQAVTATYDSFVAYVRDSAGEFSVCKHPYVATSSGWFSDRSAVYLACGRPVVLQETGFSAHLPCGRGLFAVRTVEEAAGAINEVSGDYARHSAAAREVAAEHLDARKVLGRFLNELGV